MGIMTYETWYKYTKETFNTRGHQLSGVDAGLKSWHLTLADAMHVDRQSPQWPASRAKLGDVYQRLYTAYHDYVMYLLQNYKGDGSGDMLGSRNRKMSERYSDDYATSHKNTYNGAQIRAEKQAKSEAYEKKDFTDKVSHRWNKLTGNYNAYNTGDGVIARLGKELDAEGIRFQEGFWEGQGNGSLKERLDASRSLMVQQTFVPGAFFTLRSNAKMKNVTGGLPQSQTRKAVMGASGEMMELKNSIFELLKAIKDGEGNDALSPVLGQMVEQILGQAAKEMLERCAPFFGVIAAGARSAMSARTLALECMRQSAVKTNKYYLVDSGDIGAAMKALQDLMKDAVIDAGVELANNLLKLGMSLVEHLVPGSSVAVKAVDLVQALALLAMRVTAAVKAARAVQRANNIIQGLGTGTDSGAKELFEAWPLAGAYMVTTCHTSELLLAFADIQGSLDAVPIIKKMKKLHVTPVREAALHLIDKSEWVLVPLPQKTVEKDGFLGKIEKLQEAYEGMQRLAEPLMAAKETFDQGKEIMKMFG
jgi:hypothetical protein